MDALVRLPIGRFQVDCGVELLCSAQSNITRDTTSVRRVDVMRPPITRDKGDCE